MKKIIFLGTGNAMVTKVFNTCFLIELPDGELFLTDAGGGNGILRQMELAGADYNKMHHMFITHAHTDHVMGAVWVIRKISSLINKNKYDGVFHIYCHDLVKDILLSMCEMMLKEKDYENIGENIIIHQVWDGQVLNLEQMEINVFDIYSTKAKQYGYQLRFTDDDTMLTCLGDEPYNDGCEEYAEGSDWLLSEAFCKYSDRDIFKPYEKHHSTCKEAAELAQKLHVKNLVLYHTEDKTIDTRKEAYASEARQYFSGKIFVPDDLEVIEL
ncbi:MAG: MBL fold metallo-hydrolase [Anaerovibrio sp.]|uniref:MBL fold metallo-hydrolase n=1 Tax=Anaerovibrio sp. TaxID=1872532 RepID=UPI0025FE8E4E|nr:MBL fold metallo-hydrolase [Anaerovibrio sp.]MCR5175301.1 MBL fold metallo-hydrolase [Anaerovibrio sp.]